MTFNSNLSANPALRVGDEVIAFLARSEEPLGLRVRNGPYGLLRVQGTRVSSANKEFARRNHLGSDSLDELYRRVQEAVAPKR
jgi:hypothetical protein